MNNLWLEFLVDKFVTEETRLRCCGSCQGGCLNPAICAFVCCGIPVEELNEYYLKNKDRLNQEYDDKMNKELDELMSKEQHCAKNDEVVKYV